MNLISIGFEPSPVLWSEPGSGSSSYCPAYTVSPVLAARGQVGPVRVWHWLQYLDSLQLHHNQSTQEIWNICPYINTHQVDWAEHSRSSFFTPFQTNDSFNSSGRASAWDHWGAFVQHRWHAFDWFFGRIRLAETKVAGYRKSQLCRPLVVVNKKESHQNHWVSNCETVWNNCMNFVNSEFIYSDLPSSPTLTVFIILYC